MVSEHLLHDDDDDDDDHHDDDHDDDKVFQSFRINFERINSL